MGCSYVSPHQAFVSVLHCENHSVAFVVAMNHMPMALGVVDMEGDMAGEAAVGVLPIAEPLEEPMLIPLESILLRGYHRLVVN